MNTYMIVHVLVCRRVYAALQTPTIVCDQTPTALIERQDLSIVDSQAIKISNTCAHSLR